MRRLFISIGSNRGNRSNNLIDAISRVASLPGVTVQSTSSLYETEPVGGPPQARYLNCAVAALSNLPPPALLRSLKGIEKAMGRKKSVRHGPRLIDLDILLYGDLVMEEEDLTIPHRELHKRAFALIPLLELDNSLIHPSLHQPLKQLMDDLDNHHAVKFFAPPPSSTI